MKYKELLRGGKHVPSFYLDSGEEAYYKNKLWGFAHGTFKDNLQSIVNSGRLLCSFDRRVAQTDAGKNPTGKDRTHDGQYTVYFRYVVMKQKGQILSDILSSLGSVGATGGLVFFFPLSQAVKIQKPFTLAGSIDGKNGENVITQERLDHAINRGSIRLTADDERVIRGARSDQRESVRKAQMYQHYGRRCFDNGYDGASHRIKSSEIGFDKEVLLNDIQIILHRSSESDPHGFGPLKPKGAFTTTAHGSWQVYVNQNIPLPVPLNLS